MLRISIKSFRTKEICFILILYPKKVKLKFYCHFLFEDMFRHGTRFRNFTTFCLWTPEKVAGIHIFWFAVFMSIQRRQFEQVKAAVPVIVNVLKAVSSELDDGDTDYEDLLTRSIDIAKSVQAVCLKLVCDT